jgi:hypothetical protein
MPIRCQEACKKPYKALYVYVGQRSLSHYKYIIKHMLKYVKLDEDENKGFFFYSQDVGYVGTVHLTFTLCICVIMSLQLVTITVYHNVFTGLGPVRGYGYPFFYQQ